MQRSRAYTKKGGRPVDKAAVYELLEFLDLGNGTLKMTVVNTIVRLPEDVQKWLLHETYHQFVTVGWQRGEFIPLEVYPKDTDDGPVQVRLITLDYELADDPDEKAMFMIAHEIAHSRLGQATGGDDAEAAADKLAETWGFTKPSGRPDQRQQYKQPGP